MMIRAAVYHTGKQSAAHAVLGYCEGDVMDSGDVVDLGVVRYTEAELNGIFYIVNMCVKKGINDLTLRWKSAMIVDLVNGKMSSKKKWEESIINKINRKKKEIENFVLVAEERYLIHLPYSKAKNHLRRPVIQEPDTSSPDFGLGIHESHSDAVKELGGWLVDSRATLPIESFRLTQCITVSNINGFYRDILETLSKEKTKFTDDSLALRITSLKIAMQML